MKTINNNDWIDSKTEPELDGVYRVKLRDGHEAEIPFIRLSSGVIGIFFQWVIFQEINPIPIKSLPDNVSTKDAMNICILLYHSQKSKR